MNYEEKYKQALERARQFSEHPLQEDNATIVEYIFPELAESEDEQSRKWILEYLYDGLRKADKQFKPQFKSAIAWLENQGKKLDADEVIAWLVANICDYEYYVELFKQDFKL